MHSAREIFLFLLNLGELCTKEPQSRLIAPVGKNQVGYPDNTISQQMKFLTN
jgi:hypothetical protein